MAIKTTKRKVVIEIEENDKGLNNDSKSEPEERNDSKHDSESDSEEPHEDNEYGTNSNLGWADSIAKILKTNKPKGKKSLVLSKAKKLTDLHKSKLIDAGFEVETVDGKIRQEEIEKSASSDEDKTDGPLRKKRKEIASARVKPDILKKDRERTLTKIATKGVVQLFNAVKKQQKDIDTKLEEAGTLEVKRDKVLKSIDKRQFLNVLMGNKSEKLQQGKGTTKSTVQNSSTEPTWNVLRDDFMMGGKMKDWDKELEEEEEMEQNIESE